MGASDVRPGEIAAIAILVLVATLLIDLRYVW